MNTVATWMAFVVTLTELKMLTADVSMVVVGLPALLMDSDAARDSAGSVSRAAIVSSANLAVARREKVMGDFMSNFSV